MPAPIYPQIKKMLLEGIEDKPVNSPIPSERELAAGFKTSRMTVRNAVNELVSEGYLYRDKNRGTFVADRNLHKKNTATQTFNALENRDFKIIYMSVKDADQEIAPLLRIGEYDKILRIVRVNYKDEKALNVEEIYYVRDLIPDDTMSRLPALLDLKSYRNGGRITQKFIPMLVPVKYMNFLNLKMNTPIIMVESTIFGQDGTPLIYMREYNNPFEKPIEIIS